jgi:OmpA family
MANVEQFQQGADILQQVDVSEIFTSMAMGIAAAQEKLDNNSIAQLKKLSEQEVAGKSLLELGFVPAFYSFTYADISCNISLQMSLKTDLNVGLSASLKLTSDKGYTNDQSNFATDNKYSSTSEDYKSSRHFTFKASEKTSIKIEKESYNLKQEEGSFKMIEKFEEEVMQNEKISDIESEIEKIQSINNTSTAVNVSVVNGMICISETYKETTAVGILKINAYDGKKTDLGGDPDTDDQLTLTLAPGQVFSDILPLAKTANGAGTVYGFSKDGKFWKHNGTNFVSTDLTLYFKHDSLKNKYGAKLGSTVYYGPEEVGDANKARQNSSDVKDAFLKLAELLKHDGNDKVTVSGQTDKSGDDDYNTELGNKRALALINELAARGISTSKFSPLSLGETQQAQASTERDVDFRKATIALNADYIIFVGGNFATAATIESGSVNTYIYKAANLNNGSPALNIVFGSSTVNLAAASSLTVIEEHIKQSNKEYILEKRNNVLYLLHKESVIKFYVFSKDSEKIDIQSDKSYDGSGTETENTHFIGKNTNSQSSIADSASSADKNNTFALAASVDARYSRQFDMSVQGNASMSARLVAVPPPKAFELIILNGIAPTPGQ